MTDDDLVEVTVWRGPFNLIPLAEDFWVCDYLDECRVVLSGEMPTFIIVSPHAMDRPIILHSEAEVSTTIRVLTELLGRNVIVVWRAPKGSPWPLPRT
jgi:hypothetical protein